MARLVSDAVDQARVILNDVDGTRYADADFYRYVNDAVVDARSLRPDLYVGSYGTPLTEVTALTDPIPLPDQFFTALTYLIAGRAELRDDEFAVDNRAMTLMSAFRKKLTEG